MLWTGRVLRYSFLLVGVSWLFPPALLITVPIAVLAIAKFAGRTRQSPSPASHPEPVAQPDLGRVRFTLDEDGNLVQHTGSGDR